MDVLQPGPEHLQVVITGHVDHGKSSLLGRLYADVGIIPDSLMAKVREICERQGKPFEHAFLFDAFLEEQEQGVTIDAARTFLAWKGRRYSILDAPGHQEFLKNMVTGAARAEAAIVVIDVAEGVQDQSRRHGYLLQLLGIRQFAVVINKMDLRGYGRDAFEQVRTEYDAFLAGLGLEAAAFIPASARDGENVVHTQGRMPWYQGPSVLGCLESFHTPPVPEKAPLRFVLQDVYKFDGRRILAGRVESGRLAAGERLIFWPSGKQAAIHQIESFPAGSRSQSASAGWCTGFTLETQLFLERGEVASHEATSPLVSDRFRANVFWLGQSPFGLGHRYALRLGTQEVEVEVEGIIRALDAASLETIEAPGHLRRHEAGEVVLRSLRPLALDLHQMLPVTGRFVLVEGYDICGGGIVTEVLEATRERIQREAQAREASWREGEVNLAERRARNGHGPALVLFTGAAGSGKARLARLLERRLFDLGRQVLILDSKNFRAGLSVDLDARGSEEAVRRFGEVAAILLHSGFIVVSVTNDFPAEAHPVIRERVHPHPVLRVHLGDDAAEAFGSERILPVGFDLAAAAESLLQDLEALVHLNPGSGISRIDYGRLTS